MVRAVKLLVMFRNAEPLLSRLLLFSVGGSLPLVSALVVSFASYRRCCVLCLPLSYGIITSLLAAHGSEKIEQRVGTDLRMLRLQTFTATIPGE